MQQENIRKKKRYDLKYFELNIIGIGTTRDIGL